MRKALSGAVSLGAASALALGVIMATPPRVAAQDPGVATAAGYQPYTSDQLDNLVAPVALYADPLLAQVLLAATFPEQIQSAAQYVQANGTDGIDDQYWDVSVKAVAHYPTILNMMATRIDWTTALGQAYAGQSTDVMQAVQRMRELARAQGNLESSPQQQVVVEDGYIRVWPAQPQVIYVPVYDPAVVYYQRVWGRPGFRSYFSFGVGFPIGAWLVYDWDWADHCIYYTGWRGGGWIARSRPFITITNVYVNAGYRHVSWNHDVIYRHSDWNRNAGRFAVPYQHGQLVNGSGYRQPRVVSTGAHEYSAPRQAPAIDWRRPDAGPRTAQPRQYRPAPAPAPAVEWRRPQPTPRSAQPREYRPAPAPAPAVEWRRPEGQQRWAAPRVNSRPPEVRTWSAPREARPSAPAQAPRARESAPRSNEGGRTAHRGHG